MGWPALMAASSAPVYRSSGEAAMTVSAPASMIFRATSVALVESMSSWTTGMPAFSRLCRTPAAYSLDASVRKVTTSAALVPPC